MISYRARSLPKDPEPEPLHDYSNLQIQITGRPAEIMRKMQHSIQKADLGPDGIEDELHITSRWGLHFQTPSLKLKSALRGFGPVEIKFGKSSLFRNDDADVLKIDVDSPDLHRLYALIGRVVPTHTTHPVYHPHATLAYLKPGAGKKYAGDKSMVGQTLHCHSLLFSGKKGHRIMLPLGIREAGSYRIR